MISLIYFTPFRYDPVYNGSTAYSLTNFRGGNYDRNGFERNGYDHHDHTPPPTMTRITPPHHLSNSKLATDV